MTIIYINIYTHKHRFLTVVRQEEKRNCSLPDTPFSSLWLISTKNVHIFLFECVRACVFHLLASVLQILDFTFFADVCVCLHSIFSSSFVHCIINK
jgi:hypothetical protein